MTIEGKDPGGGKMKNLFCVLLVLAFVPSCAHGSANLTNKTFDDISQTIVKGSSTREGILSEFGPPLAKVRTSDGIERWSYSEQRKAIPAPSNPDWVKTTLDVGFGKDGTVTVFSFGEIRSYR